MLPKVLAEVIGTFAMIFVGGGSIVLSEKFPQLPAWIVPLAWAGVIGVMITAMGRISGAHFNPAVTLAFTIAKRIPAAHLPVYWLSQFAGGILAVTLLRGLHR